MNELVEIEPGMSINPAHVVAVILNASDTRVRLDYGPDHVLPGDRYRELVDKINGKEIDRKEVADLLYVAWTIIANAGGGNWAGETSGWSEAATRWRDRFHEFLRQNVDLVPSEEPIIGKDTADAG